MYVQISTETVLSILWIHTQRSARSYGNSDCSMLRSCYTLSHIPTNVEQGSHFRVRPALVTSAHDSSPGACEGMSHGSMAFLWILC
jgi:hypothetical protein